MSIGEDARPIRVFVHLAKGFDARGWEKRWAAGQLIGINERMPYGYFRATEDGCVIQYSEDRAKNPLEKLLGGWVMSAAGVDLLHAWRNRTGIYSCDVVWTHTEAEYLPVLLLFGILFWKRRPKLIAQNIWLFDHWRGLSFMRRQILSRLMAKADVLTVHSPENLKVARAIFPNLRSELVPFGINTDEFAPLKEEKVRQPVHILSLGNDPHRDWQVLIRAVKDLRDCQLKIASRKITENEVASCPNIELLKVSSNEQLFESYDWADIVVVALKPNLHVSGITVLQEAALRGVAVICTDTGGLKAYFSDEEVYFVPGGDPSEIQKAIRKLAGDDALRWKLATRAQERMRSGGINSRSFARSHAELSRELLTCETHFCAAADAGGPAA
ncbi:MAG: glycosyltransferase family 4 protein [Beijerinckiaceae bacterium]|nr:glycosyltransferase family 4 protein [Beijerinckiaceae bacterium]MCI0736329.1 glycosyltransferase family 4 protein [Beijerinckiaceae bacterium]